MRREIHFQFLTALPDPERQQEHGLPVATTFVIVHLLPGVLHRFDLISELGDGGRHIYAMK